MLPARFNSFEEFIAWLDRLGLFHIELGLARMEKGLAAAGLKNPGCPVIQVIGTNGKGSTCAFLESLALANDLVPGVYTSPHFVSPLERVRIGGKPVTKNDFLNTINYIFPKLPADIQYTWFEIMTILAVGLFESVNVDLIVLEAGLGGKNDATTAIGANAICFTPIALDHAGVIGPGILDITMDKAGAFRPGCKAFTAPQFPAVKKILSDTCHGLQVTGSLPCAEWEMGLSGAYQFINASLALSAFRSLFKARKEKEGIARAFIPGRMQKIKLGETSILLDGAHNPHAIMNLCKEIKQEGNYLPEFVIFSCLADKDWRTSLKIIKKSFPETMFLIVELDNPRAAAGEKIYGECAAIQARARLCASLEQALQIAIKAESQTLITGSLYLLARFYELYPQYLTRD